MKSDGQMIAVPFSKKNVFQMIILLLQQNGCGGQMVKNGGYGVVKR